MSLSAAASEGMIAALEAALFERPDDLACSCALADLLIERGDSRGKFMQAQLALEDPHTPPGQRPGYRERERRLLKKHLREWLGDLAGFLLDDKGKVEAHRVRFERGWPETLRLPCLTAAAARALARAPQARLLRRLEIESVPSRVDDAGGPSALSLLTDAPFLGRLRCFRLGAEADETGCLEPLPCGGARVCALIERMPRLEELYLSAPDTDGRALFGLPDLTNLRVLQADFLDDFPPEALAANRSLGR